MQTFGVMAATSVGRHHRFRREPNQDAFRIFQDAEKTIGYSCDGCGSGKYSQNGSSMGAEFLVIRTLQLLDLGIPVSSVPRFLYGELLSWMKRIVDSYSFKSEEEEAIFISDNLLFTVLGFIQTTEYTVVFATGDGVVQVNGMIDLRNQDNEATYPGYHIVSPKYLKLKEEMPTNFDVYTIYTSELERVAIGSDQWLKKPELLKEVWGLSAPIGLQLQFNVWADDKVDRHFNDDATLVILERIHPEIEEVNNAQLSDS